MVGSNQSRTRDGEDMFLATHFFFKTQVYSSFYLSMLIGEPHQSALRESAACEAPTDNHNNEKKSKIKEALLERSSTKRKKKFGY